MTAPKATERSPLIDSQAEATRGPLGDNRPAGVVAKPDGRDLNGLILIDKPQGPTSHDVALRVRRLGRFISAGHTGTLDPLATGLIALLVGKSTRLAPFLAAADKTYLATIHLGLVTKTLDVTGEAVGPQYQGPYPSRVEVEKALTNLTGTMAQMPPAFSAIKVNGQTAHKAARAGKEIDLKPREVTAHALELIDYDPPFATLRAEVSKGYYVRSLARDLGLALNLIGGALAKLRRLSVGSFTLKEAGPIPETFLELKNRLISPREAVNHLPELFPSANELIALTRGQTIPWPASGPAHGLASGPTSGAAKAAGVHKIISPDGQLAALGEIFEKTPGLEPSARSPEGPFLRPLRVFAKAQEAKTNL